MAEGFQPHLLKALLPYHSFSGCDTTSAFSGKGKKQGWQLLKKNSDLAECVGKLGDDFSFNQALLPSFEQLVCKLYRVPNLTSVNEARYSLFAASHATGHALPPTQNALIYHLKRASYQAAIWKKASFQMISPPSPDGHGWKVANDSIKILWMTDPYAPAEVLKVVACSCQASACNGGRCSCYSSKLPCTDMCKCIGCLNRTVSESDQLESHTHSEEEDDDDDDD